MTISPSQAAKLRELVNARVDAVESRAAQAELGTAKGYDKAKRDVFVAEDELDAYITSLTGESK